jgi:hypothetical protein
METMGFWLSLNCSIRPGFGEEDGLSDICMVMVGIGIRYKYGSGPAG